MLFKRERKKKEIQKRIEELRERFILGLNTNNNDMAVEAHEELTKLKEQLKKI